MGPSFRISVPPEFLGPRVLAHADIRGEAKKFKVQNDRPSCGGITAWVITARELQFMFFF